MTNTNANTDDMVNTDALAPATMPTIDADAGAGVQPLADRIKSAFDDALTELIEKRDQLYADAIGDLEHESEALAEEYGLLEEGIRAIEAILPSEERLIQHQVDQLLHDGKGQDAKDKRAELAALKHKVVVMKQRMSEIQDRFLSIDKERQDIARSIFQDWYADVQRVIRSAEHGLFVVMLNGIQESMFEFQTRTGTGTSDNKHRPLVNQGHISGLTADGRSEEYAAGRHWYR